MKMSNALRFESLLKMVRAVLKGIGRLAGGSLYGRLLSLRDK